MGERRKWRLYVVAVLALLLPQELRGQCEVQRLAPFDPQITSSFGADVAVSGSRMVVGAPGDGFGIGAAYFFERQNGAWEDVGKVTDSGGGNAAIGSAVAIQGDMALVAAPHDSEQPFTDAGAVYNYERRGRVWVRTQKLTASGRQSGAQFGSSIGLSGNLAVVGSPGDNDRGIQAGAVYLFERIEAQWVEVAKRFGSDTDASDLFGVSVGIDGETIVVGARQNQGLGAAYVFERIDGQWTPTETARLVPSDGRVGDQFGTSVGIHLDTVVAGSPRRANGAAFAAGACYVFERDGVGQWRATETAILRASDARINDQLGITLAVRNATIAAGAPLSDGSTRDTGAVYLFERQDNTWLPLESRKLVTPQGVIAGHFGDAVCLVSDQLYVGATNEMVDAEECGVAYAFADLSDRGLSLAGPDPGESGVPNALITSCGTPHATVRFVFANSLGTTIIHGCAGATLDLGGPGLGVAHATATAEGKSVLFEWIPGSLSGRTVFMQAYEPATCRVSNVIVHTFK